MKTSEIGVRLELATSSSCTSTGTVEQERYHALSTIKCRENREEARANSTMQNELITSVNGDPFRSTIESLPYPYLEQTPLSSIHLPSNSGDLFYSYNSSPFSPSSLSLSPSPVPTNGGVDPAATENHLYLARLAIQYQEIVDKYERCFSLLQEATEEAETLRHENARLRMANSDLTSFLAMACNKQVNLLANEFNHIGIGAKAVPETSPTSVLPLQPLNENQLLHHAAERRAMLPKGSISIPSSGYLKMNRPAPKVPASQLKDQTRGTSPVTPGSQKVLVGLGGNKSGEEGGDMSYEFFLF